MATKVNGTLVAIYPKPNDDGSHDVDAVLEDGTVARLTISADRVGPIMAILQEGVFHSPNPIKTSSPLPELQAVDTHLAQGATSGELMVSTVELGHLVLKMNDDALMKMRSEIDRLLASRSSRMRPQ